MRLSFRFAITLGFWLVTCAVALSDIARLPATDIGLGVERYALVIGNGTYEHVTSLSNAVNDAEAVAEALGDVGFHVIRSTNLDRREMQEAISRYFNMVTPGSEALIYYAGHGVELEGQNYLLPTDIPQLDPSQQFSLRSDSISLTLLMEGLQSKRPRVSLVVLDACRDNPFPRTETRSLGGRTGLARVEPPQGTIVLYAAGAGEQALDSLGEADKDPNGLFTRNLLRLIKEPGLEIRPMVQELKERVYSAALSQANHTQRPSYYDGLIGKFYFLPEAEPAPPVSTAKRPEPKSERTRSACEVAVDPSIGREELLFVDTNHLVSLCRGASIDFPNTAVVAELLEIAEEQRAAQKALLSNSSVFSETYLKLYPAGRLAPDVRAHLASLQSEEAPAEPDPAPEPVLAPEQVALPDPEPIDPKRLALLIQTELNRVGCDAGAPDGIWGRRSDAALRAFDTHGDIALGTFAPSAEILRILEDTTARVCPLVCQATETLKGGHCVRKTCPAGQQLSSKGTCYTPQAKSTAPTTPATPKRQASKECFVFNGQTFCE